MDAKKIIRLDFAEQEVIDLSIAFTPACGVFVALSKGLKSILDDLDEMGKYRESILKSNMEQNDKNNALLQLKTEEEIALLAKKHTIQLLKELGQVIKELEMEEKPKIIIPKMFRKG